MADKYNQQDGGPATQPDAGENVSAPEEARPATIGERNTEAGVAGQGLGQMSGNEGQEGSSSSSAGSKEQS